jgi:hypothetical protein
MLGSAGHYSRESPSGILMITRLENNMRWSLKF